MNETTFRVPGISCGHCTATIERELSEMAGVQSVAADSKTKEVVVRFSEPANVETISAMLTEIAFPPESGRSS